MVEEHSLVLACEPCKYPRALALIQNLGSKSFVWTHSAVTSAGKNWRWKQSRIDFVSPAPVTFLEPGIQMTGATLALGAVRCSS